MLDGAGVSRGRPRLPPDKASELNDGLLTASEITLLKLDADWVILSACNTAGGGAEGGQALSGLARAFFYAGTRSLLVSHWAVYSDATVKLITGALSQMAENQNIGRSEALRRAMLELLEKGQPHEAHPSFWAPFVLVGEGAPAERGSPMVDGNRGRPRLAAIENPEVQGDFHLTEAMAPGRSDAEPVKTDYEEGGLRVMPLPKRRPRFARKSRNRVLKKEKMVIWPNAFWASTGDR